MRAPLVLVILSTAGAACEGEQAEQQSAVAFEMTARVGPGEEQLTCQFVKMPDEGSEIFISGGAYETGAGAHHFLLFRTAADMPPQTLDQPFDCNEGEGVMRYERGFVSGGQLEKDSARFPAGLALAFAPGEVLLMQMHVVNASPEPVDATSRIDLWRADPAEVEHRVGTLRYYNPFIHVPPNGSATASMRCRLKNDITLLTAGAHMHARGVAYRAFADAPGAPPATEPFYTTNEWEHPAYYAGWMELAAGSTLRFSCDYVNPSDREVFQGPSAEDEMCMLSAFYFPADGTEDELCASMDSHGAGTRTCAQTNSCIQLCDPADFPRFSEGSAAVGGCFQACIADSCPNATAALFPQLLCTEAHCTDQCETFGAACSACVLEHCKAELDTCQALACG